MSFVARLIAISFSPLLLNAQTPCISFAPSPALTGIGPVTTGMAAADFNGDSRPDLSYLTPNGFAIAMNTGGPTVHFFPPVMVPAGPASAIQLADIDIDGRPDVVLLKTGSVEVWRNASSAAAFSFVLGASIPISAPVKLEVAEMNNDGKPDILVLSSSAITGFRNTSTPGTVSLVSQLLAADGGVGLFAADRNGDGSAEVVLIQSQGRFIIRIFANSSSNGGDIVLSMTGFGSTDSIPTPPSSLNLVAEMTRDANVDFVFSSRQFLVILRGTSSSTIAISPSTSIDLGASITDLQIADLNSDGRNDVIAMTEAGLKVVLNTTAQSDVLFSGSILDFGALGGREIVVGNFNGDSRPDILVSGFAAQSRTLAFMNGALPLLLSVNPNPTVAGSPVEVTAVALPPACAAAQGTISFFRGSLPLGTAALAANTARISTSLSAGIQNISATFTPSDSNSVYQSAFAETKVFVDSGACAAQIPQASIQAGALRLDRVTNQFVQTITIRNDSPNPLTGPLSLATTNLPPGVNLVGSAAATGCALPSGTPFVNLDLCTGGQLAPGASISTTLRFSNPQRIAMQYTPIVLAGFAQR